MFESLHVDYADAFCLMQRSVRTQVEYRKDLDRWFASGQDLTVEGVTAYKNELVSQYKPATACRYFGTPRAFYSWLVRRDIIESSPFDLVKAPKRTTDEVIRVPDDMSVNALLAAAKTLRERLVVSLLLNGLRASEVLPLTQDSLHFQPEYGHYIVVRGKGDKERIVPLLEETVADLDAFGRDCGPDCESRWLVHNPDGSPLTYDAVNGIIDMASRKAGVDIHPHMLRHHYATRLIRAGANVFSVQKLLGHSSVATTQRYVTMDITDLVEATRLDPRRLGGIRIVPNHLEDSAQDGEDSGYRSARGLASA